MEMMLVWARPIANCFFITYEKTERTRHIFWHTIHPHIKHVPCFWKAEFSGVNNFPDSWLIAWHKVFLVTQSVQEVWHLRELHA